jgi:hypothetical protein
VLLVAFPDAPPKVFFMDQQAIKVSTDCGMTLKLQRSVKKNLLVLYGQSGMGCRLFSAQMSFAIWSYGTKEATMQT